MNILKKLPGASLLLVALIFFITFTASMNEAQSMGGPMNFISPSPSGWSLIVVIADVLFILIAIAGLKLLNIKRQTSTWLVGWLLTIAGLAILILGMTNHINAPVLDEIQNGRGKLPVDSGFHITVYAIGVVCLLASLVFLLKGRKNKEISLR